MLTEPSNTKSWRADSSLSTVTLANLRDKASLFELVKWQLLVLLLVLSAHYVHALPDRALLSDEIVELEDECTLLCTAFVHGSLLDG